MANFSERLPKAIEGDVTLVNAITANTEFVRLLMAALDSADGLAELHGELVTIQGGPGAMFKLVEIMARVGALAAEAALALHINTPAQPDVTLTTSPTADTATGQAEQEQQKWVM